MTRDDSYTVLEPLLENMFLNSVSEQFLHNSSATPADFDSDLSNRIRFCPKKEYLFSGR